MTQVPDYDETERTAILAELGRVLEGGTLGDGSRLRALLRYIVTEELEGRGTRLKAYTVATSVLGRGDDFDPSTDSIVRVEMNRLRKALDLYYAGQKTGQNARILIPKGTYRPVFPGASDVATPRRVARGTVAVAAASLLIAAMVAGAWYWHSAAPDTPPTTHPGPRVGVVPFFELTEDPKHEHLAYGLTVDLVNELARFAWLSVFLTAEPGSEEDGGAETRRNLDYLLRGTVRQSEDDISVSILLTDADDGQIFWSQRYRESPSASDLIRVQQDAASMIAVEIGRPGGQIARLEERRVTSDADLSTSAYGCVLRTYAYWQNFNEAQHASVRTCLEQALETETSYSHAYAALAFLYLDELRYGYNPRPEGDSLEDAGRMARRAYALNSANTLAAQALFTYFSQKRNLEEFREVGERAIARAPNNPELLADFGNKLALSAGEWSRGIALVERALERNANPPGWYFIGLSYDAYWRGAPEEALQYSERMKGNPRMLYHLVRLASFARLEDGEGVSREMREMAGLGHGTLDQVEDVVRRQPFDRALQDRLIGDIRSAGNS